jgi:orotate phosphoribosyltransferase
MAIFEVTVSNRRDSRRFMNRDALARSIFRLSHLTGDFTLRSGQRSAEYFDKYRFESQPDVLREIARQMRPFVPPGTDILAGLEMGGIPLATALSLETMIPALFVRKKAKAYGTCKIAEGPDFVDKRTLVIEDVVTTGGQVIESVSELRKAGALISDVVCVILRNPDAHRLFDEVDLTLHPLFTMEELTALSRSR